MLTKLSEPACLGPHPAALGTPFDLIEKLKFCKQSHLVFASWASLTVGSCAGASVSEQVESIFEITFPVKPGRESELLKASERAGM